MLQEQPPKERNGRATLGYLGRKALRRELCDMLRNGGPPTSGGGIELCRGCGTIGVLPSPPRTVTWHIFPL